VQLVSGVDDQMWPASDLADIALRRLEAHRHPFPFRHLKYPEAGHTILVPYWPLSELRVVTLARVEGLQTLRRLPRGFLLLWHQNRRSTHLLTHAGDDHRRRHGVAACHVNLESTTEVAVAHIGPQRPVQRTTLFSVEYARIFEPNLRHSLDI
jgi:hypothetical protein